MAIYKHGGVILKPVTNDPDCCCGVTTTCCYAERGAVSFPVTITVEATLLTPGPSSSWNGCFPSISLTAHTDIQITGPVGGWNTGGSFSISGAITGLYFSPGVCSVSISATGLSAACGSPGSLILSFGIGSIDIGFAIDLNSETCNPFHLLFAGEVTAVISGDVWDLSIEITE